MAKRKNLDQFGPHEEFPPKSTIVPWEQWSKFVKPIEIAPLSKKEMELLAKKEEAKNQVDEGELFDELEEQNN